MAVGNLLAKVIGLTALGITGYDTLATTRDQAPRYIKHKELARLEDSYLRTDNFAVESVVSNNMQNWARNHHLGSNWIYKMWDNVSCYTSCFFDNVKNNLMTFGLGIVTLIAGKNYKPITKVAEDGAKTVIDLTKTEKALNKINRIKVPFLAEAAGVLLAIQAGWFVIHDLFGFFSGNPRVNKP